MSTATKQRPKAPQAPPADLADLIWSGASQDDISEHMRSMDIEPPRLIAQFALLTVAAIPKLNRAILQGDGASDREIECRQRLRMIQQSTPMTDEDVANLTKRFADTEAELADHGTAAADATAASNWINKLAWFFPRLVDHPKGGQAVAGKVVAMDAIREACSAINFPIRNKLDLAVVNGWPTSAAKHDYAGVVKLVTVSQPGMRGAK